MRYFRTTVCLVVLTALPSLAAADVSVSAGATLASQYLSNGLEQTTGPALQPWIEAESMGFYMGLWASNTDKDIVGSKYEIDLTAGYRGEVGKLSYDLGYARYYYAKPDVDCCGEFIASLSLAATDQLGLGARFAYDNDAEVLNARISVDFAVTDKIGLSASAGRIDHGGQDYWTFGGSYALSDTLSVSASWNDTDVTDGILYVGLDTSFSLH